MSIKRYDTQVGGLDEAEDGFVVAYDDHVAEVERLTAERDELAKALAECLEYLDPDSFYEVALVAAVVGRGRAALAALPKEDDDE